jgi:hypothetical protein
MQHADLPEQQEHRAAKRHQQDPLDDDGDG